MPVTPTSFARRSTEASASPYAEGPRQRPSPKVVVVVHECQSVRADVTLLLLMLLPLGP
jgi:hypothetical protein